LEHEHPAVSLTEGERLAVILYNKPFQAPSFDAVLEWDVEVLCLPPTAHLQTRTTHELVLPPQPFQADSDTSTSTSHNVAEYQGRLRTNEKKTETCIIEFGFIWVRFRW
jgi:hypothetical protein